MLSLKHIVFGSCMSGCKILWLIFVIQTMILLQTIYKVASHLPSHGSQWIKNNIMVLSMPIFTLFYTTVPTYLLWKGIRQCSKKLLRSYVIVKSVLVPIRYSGPIIIMNYTSWLSNWPKTFLQIAPVVIIHIFMFVCDIYGICVVYICYKKLESPIIAHMYDHCLQLREVQSENLAFIEDPSHKLNHNEDKYEKTVPVDPYQLESFILNPLDVAIDNGTVLGEGAFGIVYKGIFHHKKKKIQIAAKVAKDTQSSETIEMILQEIKILIHVGNHDNIITFYGVTSDASIDNHLALITEFVSFGCLEDFLKEKRQTFKDFTRESGLGVHPDKSLVYINLDEFGTHSTIDLIRLSVDIAKGMEHLATKKIIHGDLASRNVLLTKDLRAKLTDFGMSRRLYAYQIYSTMDKQKCLLPWRWMSVEAIEDLNLSEKSDVWSYGVTLWEIFTLGEFPFNEVQWSVEIPKQLRQGLMKLKRPRYATFKLYNIMTECWSIDLNRRPTFKIVLKKFDEIMEEIKLDP